MDLNLVLKPMEKNAAKQVKVTIRNIGNGFANTLVTIQDLMWEVWHTIR